MYPEIGHPRLGFGFIVIKLKCRFLLLIFSRLFSCKSWPGVLPL